MNASALLKSQGWRGKGHSLHPTDNSIGLANPLLLSRNTDGKGLGANKTFTDQWWLAAFDEKLKGLDVQKGGVVTQTVKEGALNAAGGGGIGGRYSGLYASFVRGGLMEGTLEELEKERQREREGETATPQSEDRESVAGLRKGVVKRKESKDERRRRREEKVSRKKAKEEKRRRKEAKAAQATIPKNKETKAERKARREERRARKEARRIRREEKEARKAAKG
ncbi:hypothetical protein GE09DRAFT_2836 [Coniochaeta sp. 2T2.1]|nr:hypothetical protein GE09DRAFT_2836 [Coniochaeta sp. 2T2.1]